MVKVNPRQARRFAEASGQLAKLDRCDAAMLARMGSALELEPRPVISQTTDELKELLGARDALIKDRVAASTGGRPLSRHRQCPDRRNARTRPTRARSGCKPRRPRPNRQRQWKILR
jgi:transposase